MHKNIPLKEPRQKQVLELLYEGYSYKEMSKVCGIKVTSIREHVCKLYEKLMVKDSLSAIRKAKELGLIKNL